MGKVSPSLMKSEKGLASISEQQSRQVGLRENTDRCGKRCEIFTPARMGFKKTKYWLPNDVLSARFEVRKESERERGCCGDVDVRETAIRNCFDEAAFQKSDLSPSFQHFMRNF